MSYSSHIYVLEVGPRNGPFLTVNMLCIYGDTERGSMYGVLHVASFNYLLHKFLK